MPTTSVNWAVRVWAVVRKDLTTEFRTRYAFNAVVMFAVVTLTMISLSLGLNEPSKPVLASLFWVVFFFAAMSGLAQVFVREEEAGTAPILKLSSSGSVIFFGKMLFNLLLLTILAVVIIPLFIVFFETAPANWPLFLVGLLSALIGLAGSTTIIAAIISKATVKGALFTVLSFPALMPLLVAAVEITSVSFVGGGFEEILAPLQLLVAFDVVMITLSVMLFDFVWRL